MLFRVLEVCYCNLPIEISLKNNVSKILPNSIFLDGHVRLAGIKEKK